MKLLMYLILTLALLASLALVTAEGQDRGHGGPGHGGPGGNGPNAKYCNPNTAFFQYRNGLQWESGGNWSQSISYLIPGIIPGVDNPGALCYAGSALYYQSNYYDQNSCAFYSVQGWPNCVGPISLANFPNGLYLQTVKQGLVIPQYEVQLQEYTVQYLTPAVPIVPAQNTNTWVSVSIPPSALANIVYQNDANGNPTTEVVYAESIMSTQVSTPEHPLKRRIYTPATLTDTVLTALAPFYSDEIAALPSPYDQLIGQYRAGEVRLSYFSSCDGYNWALSNCRQCGAGNVRTPCGTCAGGAALQCVSSYFLPFSAGNDPCAA